MRQTWAAWIIAIAVAIVHQTSSVGAARIGVCYGRVADNLPPPKDVIALYKKLNIELIRIFDPDHSVLDALRGSGLTLLVGTKNEDLPNLAGSPEAAKAWVDSNVVPYKDDVLITWISVGNEVIPGELAIHVPDAMNNLYNALVSVGLDKIKVTTVAHALTLGVGYPPSQGAFTDEVLPIMTKIMAFLTKTNSPLMVNVYPYYAYEADPTHISLEYAQFADHPVVTDGNLQYYGLFDAILDAFFSAMERAGGPDVPIIISETGWPTAGHEPYSSIDNAQRYNSRVRDNVLSTSKPGTPKRPQAQLDTFFFAMFNENLKSPGIEQNFGFFKPDMEPVYPFW